MEVSLEVSTATKEFVVKIENNGPEPIRIPVHQGIPLRLKVEIWSYERGVAGQPRAIRELSEKGVFIPLEDHILKSREKFVVSIKWTDLVVGQESNLEFLKDVFSSGIHVRQLVFARAFIGVDLEDKNSPEIGGTRFESKRVPVYIPK